MVEKSDKEEIDEEQENATSSGNCVEIFFQPKQHNLETISKLEIFATILNEKIFDQLRNKEDLCYKTGCEIKKIAGTVGITFFI